MALFTQLLLSIVILSLTILVSVAGFQVIRLLHDLRQTVHKMNRILSNTEALSETSVKPITAVNTFFSDVKTLVDQTQDDIISSLPDRVISPKAEHLNQKSSSPRFFKRSGLPLKAS